MKFGSNICHDKAAVIGIVIMTLMSPLLIYASIVWSFDQECGEACYDVGDTHGFALSSGTSGLCHATGTGDSAAQGGFECIDRDTGESLGTGTLCGCNDGSITLTNETVCPIRTH